MRILSFPSLHLIGMRGAQAPEDCRLVDVRPAPYSKRKADSPPLPDLADGDIGSALTRNAQPLVGQIKVDGNEAGLLLETAGWASVRMPIPNCEPPIIITLACSQIDELYREPMAAKLIEQYRTFCRHFELQTDPGLESHCV